jgi:hypothetical protein
MGMYHTTYFAYGVHVALLPGRLPWEESEHCEAVLAQHKDQLSHVRFLTAGDYDADQLFLTTRCQRVEYGEWMHVTTESPEPALIQVWDRQLSDAVDLLGYGDRAVSAPGWLCVPDLS